MTGRAITKSAKRRRQTLDVLPPAVRRAVRAVLSEFGAEGLWVLLAELGVDGPAAMAGELVDTVGELLRFRHGSRWWVISAADAELIEQWLRRRRSFITFGAPDAATELGEWLRGPVSTAVRRHLGSVPYAAHVAIGVRNLNAISRERLVELCDGNEALLWELTGRIGVPTDLIEPHSTDRVHRLIDAATSEFTEFADHHPRVEQ